MSNVEMRPLFVTYSDLFVAEGVDRIGGGRFNGLVADGEQSHYTGG